MTTSERLSQKYLGRQKVVMDLDSLRLAWDFCIEFFMMDEHHICE